MRLAALQCERVGEGGEEGGGRWGGWGRVGRKAEAGGEDGGGWGGRGRAVGRKGENQRVTRGWRVLSAEGGVCCQQRLACVVSRGWRVLSAEGGVCCQQRVACVVSRGWRVLSAEGGRVLLMMDGQPAVELKEQVAHPSWNRWHIHHGTGGTSIMEQVAHPSWNRWHIHHGTGGTSIMEQVAAVVPQRINGAASSRAEGTGSMNSFCKKKGHWWTGALVDRGTGGQGHWWTGALVDRGTGGQGHNTSI
ncbi:unnamed protein product [Closterium sp. Naga37s-1]|nr:unnamed protein product [Closterium sp. Naga37s-1]